MPYSFTNISKILEIFLQAFDDQYYELILPFRSFNNHLTKKQIREAIKEAYLKHLITGTDKKPLKLTKLGIRTKKELWNKNYFQV